MLDLSGYYAELDRRIQTDPLETSVIAKVRGFKLNRFGIGIGIYHSGTVGMEFDNDGVKCGWATDNGWKVQYLKGFKTVPPGKWFYIRIDVYNPFPNPDVFKKYGDIDPYTLRPVKVRCSAWDASGRLINSVVPTYPPANTHYVALDEGFMHIWGSGNHYQVDWFYAGPPSGISPRFATPGYSSIYKTS